MKDAGLTLIEVLVALAIFTALSVAVLGLLPTLFKVNRQNQNDQAVTVAAKAFMESVRTAYSVQSTFDAGSLPAAPGAGLLNGLTCTATQSNPVPTWVSPSSGPLLRRVTLSCAGNGQPTYTFSLDFGRPAS
ncbi:prepilin-type N-terminal cleavage/methylation domain-containing protein [Deinococcus taeanensis]|uniref:prepilin-type N-terminal cleavage/methylation domain-containing protein n=1 Tax=Deinococcus taeanensis TaxID=2737050 RepID=UPI001CDCB808|nr:prepilin-type N-terminal cleavage/methylation domain-containing protein [Deinococcus taeanensis]UBV42069.1 prepilin-type N-terminal cleavage/methylation domain-containing protein [Deinococcus taeanensis]